MFRRVALGLPGLTLLAPSTLTAQKGGHYHSSGRSRSIY
jgi:hypothetical protein